MNPLKSLRKSPDNSNISVFHSILGFTTWLENYVKIQANLIDLRNVCPINEN